ncbi:hypothetical protein BH24ACT1_BH24ACT1_05260 [soil metagenome]
MGPLDRSRVILVVVDDVLEVIVAPGDRRPDLALVNELARLQLTARRLGYRLRLRSPCSRVEELLDLVGLVDVFARQSGSGLETRRKSECGEQLGIEEVVEPGDPPGGDLDHLEGEGLERP